MDNVRCPNMQIIGISGEREKEQAGETFEEIMANIFLKLRRRYATDAKILENITKN